MKFSAGFGRGGSRSPYRYTLRRDWRDEAGLFPLQRHYETACFLMLNPSTADAFKNDPTVAKCCRIARRLGYGALDVRNIFAYRSTDPTALKTVADPVGPGNNRAIYSCLADPSVTLIVCAWGNWGSLFNRSEQVHRILKRVGKPAFCFAMSKEFQPVHPLYQPEDRPLIPMDLR